MVLKRYELKKRYSELIEKISINSRDFADFLLDNGVDESCAEELLKFFASDSDINKFSTTYKELLENGMGVEFFKAMKEIGNIDDLMDFYPQCVLNAQKKNIPVNDFIRILSENELYELDDALNNYVPEDEEKTESTEEKSDIPSNICEKENAPATEDKNKTESSGTNPNAIKIEVLDKNSRFEKNMFTQTIEDLLGISIDTLEQEEPDGNLDTLVKSITDAILNDKRKTNLINNLRRVVNIANKQVIRMTEKMNKCAATENELRAQIYKVSQERDEYKKKFEELNEKIGELSSLAALTGGIKRIE